MTEELRFRQIHLDFHTSEKIAGVGARFERARFQEMLREGHVDSVTLFAKCHHGMSYHETNVGVRHPGMAEDLLPAQLDACREIDVRTPIYISAGLDEASIFAHPDWGYKDRDGRVFEPLSPGFKMLCFNTPYLDYLCAQIEEVVEKFDGDGIFLDIIGARRCYCSWCMKGMLAEGVNPLDDAQAEEYAARVLQNYYARTTAAARSKDPNHRVFHNSGHIPKGGKAAIQWNSHLELESLPTGGWGYDHFPISAKYAATTGYDFLGMTGKFHTTWGEFGGFKRADALRYECAAMLAFGAKCSIGDQLHPSGEMNPDTYRLVGAAYTEVETKEPWVSGARAVSEIALVSPEALRTDQARGAWDHAHAEEGAARMLLEAHLLFDVIDLDRDLAPYKLVILPDEIVLSGENAAHQAFARRLEAFVGAGGKLLLSGRSGLTPDQTGFAVWTGLADRLTVAGRSPWNPDYLIPTAALPTSPARGPLVIHGGAWDVVPELDSGLQVLALRAEPYFNRAFDHFCSHFHTPDNGVGPYPGAVGDGEAVYFAHDIFTRYRRYGQPVYRDFVVDAIRTLISDPIAEAILPSTARLSLMVQPEEERYVLHLLFATPVLRGAAEGEDAKPVEVIEDLTPLYDVRCRVNIPRVKIRSARLAPTGETLEIEETAGGGVTFTVPKVLCHQMVELSE
ncbi:hypothetical protein CCAX7_10560 [Capsulimonas corticalis]|uniref:Uncharacterized protein n=1 Tax=Capsulimonas corticalis TaxID=2219043 RepID=A0A402CUK5_9BACT|nr:beta-galactosidase trimerization domain-containing protein [Capsulimonas corticalis]BDI29005.1 hypothetical protein CCAX7_10560 [Capsulimonas corticalis]